MSFATIGSLVAKGSLPWNREFTIDDSIPALQAVRSSIVLETAAMIVLCPRNSDLEGYIRLTSVRNKGTLDVLNEVDEIFP